MILYKDETEATPYMLDLLHDRNTEVQRVCDATLQMIGDLDSRRNQLVCSQIHLKLQEDLKENVLK